MASSHRRRSWHSRSLEGVIPDGMEYQNLETREDFETRIQKAREKAIELGLANPENVNQVFYDMPLETFREHFSDFHVSRAFFKDK